MIKLIYHFNKVIRGLLSLTLLVGLPLQIGETIKDYAPIKDAAGEVYFSEAICIDENIYETYNGKTYRYYGSDIEIGAKVKLYINDNKTRTQADDFVVYVQ